MSYQVNYGTIKANALVVPLALAKKNSRIDYADEDDLFLLFVEAAGLEIENYLGRPILEREDASIQLDRWPTYFMIPFPVNGITGIKYGTQTVDPTDYSLFANELQMEIEEPADFTGPLIIKISIGYTTDAIPADIKRAALMIFSRSDTYREDMPIKLETSVKALLRPYKMY